MNEWLMIFAGVAGLAVLAWVLSFGSRGRQLDIMRKMGARSTEAPGDPDNPVILKPVSRKAWLAVGVAGLVLAAGGIAKSGYLSDILRGQAL